MKNLWQIIKGFFAALFVTPVYMQPVEIVANRVRIKFRDVAFPYRMGAGFPGDVNRAHPFSVEPCLQNATTPATLYGQAVLADTVGATNTVRMFGAGDSSVTDMYGVTVRPFPLQAATAPGSFGQQQLSDVTTPPGSGFPIDVLRMGYIMVKLNTGQTSPTKGATVYVRTAATSGNNVQGGFETAASTSATLSSRYTYNGPADANGNVEICIR